jgi:hypothetical protein
MLGARALSVALLWAVGLSLCAPSARAGGCHAPDRPVLGLSALAGDAVPRTPALDHAPARFAPVPCSGEVPGSSSRVQSARPVATAGADEFTPREARAVPLVTAETRVRARLRPERLDRPPRTSPATQTR